MEVDVLYDAVDFTLRDSDAVKHRQRSGLRTLGQAVAVSRHRMSDQCR